MPVEARATATDDPAEVDRVTRMLAEKYGLQFTAFMLVEKGAARGERAREVIHLHPTESRSGPAAAG